MVENILEYSVANLTKSIGEVVLNYTLCDLLTREEYEKSILQSDPCISLYTGVIVIILIFTLCIKYVPSLIRWSIWTALTIGPLWVPIISGTVGISWTNEKNIRLHTYSWQIGFVKWMTLITLEDLNIPYLESAIYLLNTGIVMAQMGVLVLWWQILYYLSPGINRMLCENTEESELDVLNRNLDTARYNLGYNFQNPRDRSLHTQLNQIMCKIDIMGDERVKLNRKIDTLTCKIQDIELGRYQIRKEVGLLSGLISALQNCEKTGIIAISRDLKCAQQAVSEYTKKTKIADNLIAKLRRTLNRTDSDNKMLLKDVKELEEFKAQTLREKKAIQDRIKTATDIREEPEQTAPEEQERQDDTKIAGAPIRIPKMNTAVKETTKQVTETKKSSEDASVDW